MNCLRSLPCSLLPKLAWKSLQSSAWAAEGGACGGRMREGSGWFASYAGLQKCHWCLWGFLIAGLRPLLLPITNDQSHAGASDVDAPDCCRCEPDDDDDASDGCLVLSAAAAEVDAALRGPMPPPLAICSLLHAAKARELEAASSPGACSAGAPGAIIK